jgi:hypothetical protein
MSIPIIRKLINLIAKPQESKYTIPFGKHTYGDPPKIQGAMPWLPYLMRGSKIGKYCSFGSNIKFAFFGKHDYELVTTYPFVAFYDKWKNDTPTNPIYHQGSIIESKIPVAPIIIENDV